jgi:hypothetical protein
LCLDELKRVPSHTLKERLATAHNDWVNDQPQLVYQVRIHEAGYKTCSTDNIRVLSWRVLQRSKLRDVPDDLRLGPRDALERGR